MAITLSGLWSNSPVELQGAAKYHCLYWAVRFNSLTLKTNTSKIGTFKIFEGEKKLQAIKNMSSGPQSQFENYLRKQS